MSHKIRTISVLKYLEIMVKLLKPHGFPHYLPHIIPHKRWSAGRKPYCYKC